MQYVVRHTTGMDLEKGTLKEKTVRTGIMPVCASVPYPQAYLCLLCVQNATQNRAPATAV